MRISECVINELFLSKLFSKGSSLLCMGKMEI